MLTVEQASHLYQTDYQLWLAETVGKLRSQNFSGLDLENLIEEIEILASRDRAEIESRSIVLWVHLLKRIYINSEYDNRGWEVTIREQRRQLKILLKQSPSLKRYFIEVLDQAWEEALIEVREDYPQIEFPDLWEFSLNIDVLLSEKFWDF